MNNYNTLHQPHWGTLMYSKKYSKWNKHFSVHITFYVSQILLQLPAHSWFMSALAQWKCHRVNYNNLCVRVYVCTCVCVLVSQRWMKGCVQSIICRCWAASPSLNPATPPTQRGNWWDVSSIEICDIHKPSDSLLSGTGTVETDTYY